MTSDKNMITPGAFEMLKVPQGGSISTLGCSRHLANTSLQQMAGDFISVGYSYSPLLPMQTIIKDYDLTILFSQNLLSAIFYKTGVTMRNLLNKYVQSIIYIIYQKKIAIRILLCGRYFFYHF